MYQTGNVVLALGLYGNNVTALPDGNDGLPQEFAVGRRRDDFLQAVPDLTGLDTHMAADISQFCRSGIRDFLFGKDRSENPVFQIFVGG